MIDVYIILLIIVLFVLYKFKLMNINYLFYILPLVTMYLDLSKINLNSLSLLKSSYKPCSNSSLRPKSKRRLSESVKKIVASNQRWTCNMCHNILDASYEVDHIIPLYKGGSNDINNLQALCRNCHGMKTINDKLNI